MRNLKDGRRQIRVTALGLPKMSVNANEGATLMLYPNTSGSEIAFEIRHPAENALDQGKHTFSIEAINIGGERDRATALCAFTVTPFVRYHFGLLKTKAN